MSQWQPDADEREAIAAMLNVHARPTVLQVVELHDSSEDPRRHLKGLASARLKLIDKVIDEWRPGTVREGTES